MAGRLKERITLITDMETKKSLRNIIPTPTRITMNMVQTMAPMGKRRESIMISLPELNELLVAHNCLHAISIQLNVDGMAYDLSLSISASASEKVGADVVSIRFIDISQFTSRDFGGGLTQLMHMNVNKLDSGFDRMRYQLSDLEDKKLSFYFSSFSLD
ncbi:hypothetical protein CCL09_10265 [Pseudomonas congelans]|nr:hypothetical protein CCL09_10265 [Pseudomonas congelans]